MTSISEVRAHLWGLWSGTTTRHVTSSICTMGSPLTQAWTASRRNADPERHRTASVGRHSSAGAEKETLRMERPRTCRTYKPLAGNHPNIRDCG